MVRKRARTLTLLKLSPLYLLSGIILYVLFVMDKDFNYLDSGRASFAEQNFTQALDQLDIAIDKKKYKGRQLLDALMLRARTLNIMKGYTRALQDLEKIIQLSPKSEDAYQARALMGDILLNLREFQKAIDTYEFLAVEIEKEDEVRCYEYRSKAAAAAYQYSNFLMSDVTAIIQSNTTNPEPIREGLIRYVLDFHTDYDLPFVESLLKDQLSDELIKETIDLTMEARRYHHHAYDIFQEYPLKSFFNPLASLFLTNIYYRTHKFFPALFESSMAMKEAIPPQQQIELLEIRAKIYEEVDAFTYAADTYKTLRQANTNPWLVLDLLRKNYLCLLRSGNYDKVIAEIPPLLNKTGGDFVLQYCQGIAYLEKDKKTQAIAILSNIVNSVFNGSAPPNFLNTEERRDSFMQLFKACIEIKDYGKALDTLAKAIQIYPEDLEFRRKRTEFFCDTLKNPQGAVHDYYFLMTYGSRESEHFKHWYDGMDLAYQAVNQKSLAEKARQEVNKFARLEAMIGSNAKRYPELMEAATFPATSNDIPLRVALSIELLKQGRREQSKGILRMLVRSYPEILEFSYLLGMMYFQEGNASSALTEFMKVLERDPPDIESVKKALDCYEELRDYTGKGRMVRTLLEKDYPYLKSWILTRLSFDQGKQENCLRMYRTIADAPPSVQEDLDLMAAWCLVEEDEFADAEDLIDPILRDNPRHIGALKAKAKLLLAHPGPITRIAAVSEEDETGGPEPENSEQAKETKISSKEGNDSTALNAAEEILPPELQKIGPLVGVLRYLSEDLTRRDLKDLTTLFVERNHPELVPRLLEGARFQFSFSPEICHAVATAYQKMGEYEKAVDILLAHGTSEEDLRWALGLCAYSAEAIPQSRSIIKKYPNTITDAEPFLRAAIGASLNLGISEANQRLAESDSFSHWGTYTEHDAEYIDYLVHTLNRFAKQGLDISIEEVPVKPLKESVEASSGVSPAGADGDAQVSEIPDSPADQSRAPTDSKNPKPKQGTGRFDPDNKNEPPPAAKTQPKKEKKKQAIKELPELTASDIAINGIPLRKKYRKIVAEAVHMANLWRISVEPEDIILVKSLLRHLLLRKIPFMEKECMQEAEKAVKLDPLCGLAWRYLLDHKAGEQSPDRVLTILTPVNNAIPDDYETLRRITIAFGRMKINTLLLPCLQALQGMCSGPQEAALVEAEILLAIGSQEEAHKVCKEILAAEEATDIPVLKRLTPILAGLGAIPDLNHVVTALLNAQALDESSLDQILSQLEYATLSLRDQAFLEKLYLLSTDRQKARVIVFLANSYAQTKEVLRLEAMTYELARLPNAAGQNDEIMYRAFMNTGTALEALGLNHEALELIENLYYLRPDKADTLTLLAEIAAGIGKLRKATEYLNLNHLLRPWDNKNNITLAHNWFFETGEFKKAFNLVRKSKGLSATDPEEAARILMSYSFLMGEAPQAINYAAQFYSNPEAQTPSIMFLTASLYYFFEQNAEARKLYARLNFKFSDNPFAERTRYLIDRLSPIIKPNRGSR
ncbi:MAG: tetratricopeptide repeat protein [Planctomycetota bacterium]